MAPSFKKKNDIKSNNVRIRKKRVNLRYCMRKSHRHTKLPSSSSSTFNHPINNNIPNNTNFIPRSSHQSPSHEIQEEHYGSNSFHAHLSEDTISSIIHPQSTADDDGQLEADAAGGLGSRGSDCQTIDIAAVLENQQLRNSSNAKNSDAPSPREKTFLYRSALKGEWRRVESLIEKYPHYARCAVTKNQETVLHVAAGAKQTGFVKELVHRMSPTDMTMQNKYGNTALCFAATSGIVRIAQLIVNKNEDLPLIRGFSNLTPLFMAVSYKRKLMATYLFAVTDIFQLTPEDQIELLIASIHSDFFDISLQITRMNPNLATMKCSKNNNESALHVMARKPLAIGSATKQLSIWRKCIKFGFNGKFYDKNMMNIFAREVVKFLWEYIVEEFEEKEMLEFIKYPTRLLHDATRAENVEFLIILINLYPDIVWEEDDEGKTIFDVAIENRLENVFNLIDEIGGLNEFAMKHRLTNRNYSMLHTVANLATPNNLNRVTGAAFQMQRELLWFKEVEKIVLPSQLMAKSNDPNPQLSKLTPRELFTENHKDLRKAGEEWMKNTANSCMIVAALITTVVFAAAFTVPGGCDDNTGNPIFQSKPWFTVFVISDAAALVSSSTSILMFMSILTSRYAEDDFLHSLPSRLLIGLTSLFVSIVCMVVTFTATFFLLYQNAKLWVPLTVAVMTILPVCCFCRLQFKLWVDTFHNTYLSRFLFRSRGRLFSL
ncbi:hypothetical protein IC575_029428 [Cucumis melo]